MTKQELLNSLATKFSKVLEPIQGVTEGTIVHWAVPVFDLVNNVLVRQWVHFYVDGSNAYWQDREPKFVASPVASFTDKVNLLIQEKVVANIIKFGVISELNLIGKRCIVSVIMADKTKKEALVVENDAGVLSIEIL